MRRDSHGDERHSDGRHTEHQGKHGPHPGAPDAPPAAAGGALWAWARAWARAAHPVPVLVVTGLTACLAVSLGHSAASTMLLVLAVLTGQLSVGWLNDLVDAGRDARAGRVTKPVAQGRLAPAAVTAMVVGSALAAIALSLACGWPAALAHLVALVSAWVYDLGAKATAWSVLPYLVSFGLLPAFVSLALPGGPLPPLWLVASGALLGGAAHFVNTLPDLADDARVGVRGLPHRLGAVGSRVAAAVALLGSALLLVGPPGLGGDLRLLALLVAAGTAFVGLLHRDRRRGDARLAFQTVLLVAALDMGLLLTAGLSAGTAG
ncbi:UbiA family prenyltransferase [Streptomyces sp. DSM 44915]|uniref:UbiA family prenyltransferase n=1 Tax=Streptomyces chisholmiae TaxID=3075540 RepID=A0ABU2JUN3_9ACTN|nr:UbiA family prenyltransferase [Streptomyces sp. DSM 44915]MDT0268453.1 UbiA family prenyltransferase [Streptomyces sp. DSM 44915]